jgi:DNA helicase-2/ATP-dependent DNA helicase PcrA
MAWNDKLEGKTLEIASSNQSPLRVVAGPGTGKTFALMRRIARLLEEGADPKRILLVTFTRVAANDLEKELDRLKVQNAPVIRKGTLHSVCFSILGQQHVLQITGRTPRPLLEYEERFLLEDLGLDKSFGKYYERKATLQAFEASWATEIQQDPMGPNDDNERRFQVTLNEWLRFHQAMLLEELAPETLKYLNDNPASPERSKFAHVLVDEYQDLNRAEQKLIDLLAGYGTLTVIGDEDQSIYEAFRFAHPEGISEFHIEHPGTHDVPLSECRRCPTNLVAIATALIKNNLRRKGHDLLPKPGNGEGNLHIVQWQTVEEEVNGIAKYVHNMIEREEFDPGEVLILCPRRQFGYMIRDALVKLGRSAHSFFHEEELDGNPKKLDECSSQEAFTLLTLLVKPDDRVALRCWLGFGNVNLRAEEYQRLREYCSKKSIEPRQTLDGLLAGSLSIDGTRGITKRYKLLIDRLESLKLKTGLELFDALFPSDQDWTDPFRTIVGGIQGDQSVDKVFDLLKSNITQPELPTNVEYIRVMSLHKSKGLTADHVIVTDCIEGLIPYRLDGPPSEEQLRYVEEQRRLFYVAITRPTKTLVLSSVLSLPRKLAFKLNVPVHNGNKNVAMTTASSFLAELGKDRPKAILGKDWFY